MVGELHPAWKERHVQDATRIIRCWTVLANLTGVELLIQLWPVMLRIARLVAGFRRGTPSPEALFQFETNLQELHFACNG